MRFGGVVNEHACQGLPLACEVKQRCEIAAQPGSIIPGLAKLCHSSPIYLYRWVSESSIYVFNFILRNGAC